ncbi:beta-glucoside-specific PTS transporter subunit IIABC [Vibrio cincinnatiensis]|uniref:beta-glucoside-specific PTS transporter subunit IIABC n=1 Tax=Vibrio cincinnatiensis TaxID=675 RepID=UPI001EDDF588|nr:beta-glucoside-specific PTS transporter subunit IIABC [Vibrio cincinnatiensis]MCG3729342.1 PTS beta-glucoside transporter subunit EIIBCA [Vibrio cincinnatiensis]
MAKIRDYQKLANDILNHVGGQENVVSFTRCATRLRMVLKNTPENAKDKVEKLTGVITVVESGGQFQVVIGTHVSDVYEHMVGLVDPSKLNSDGQKVRILDAVIASMSAIFAPIVYILAAAGLLQGFLIVVKYFVPTFTSTGTFAVLNFMSWTPFAFLPVFIAITASKHFNCNPFIAVFCSCVLINPDWAAIAAQISNGEVITFLSFPLAKTVYTSSVLPPIFMIWGLSYVERYAKRVIPAMVSELLTPLVCVIIVVPLTLVLIGPVSSTAAEGVAHGYNWLFEAFPPLAAALIGGIWQMVVVFGVHWGITPVIMANFDMYGRDSFQAFQSMAVIAQMAAAFAVAFKSRNQALKTTSFSAGITAIFGITEPTLYGVTLRLKKPFICGCVGGAAGALVASLFGTYYYAYAGLPGLLTAMNAINVDNPQSFIGMALGVGVTIVTTFILINIIGFQDAIAEDDAQKTPAPSSEATVTPKVTMTLISPAKGELIALEEVNDPSFSSKLLGDGVAIKPVDGVIKAPCDAIISSVIDSHHAVGMTCENGANILIHVGLDTVNLKGQYFETKVVLNQKVKAGDPLIQFDCQAIKNAGYDLTTPFIVLNSDEFSLNINKQESNQIQFGQPLIQLTQ